MALNRRNCGICLRICKAISRSSRRKSSDACRHRNFKPQTSMKHQSSSYKKELLAMLTLSGLAVGACFADEGGRIYQNKLTPIKHPKPLLADHPEYIQPIREPHRFEAPAIVDEAGADLHVRA